MDLETEISNGYKDDEQDDTNSGASSHEALCNDPYCTCPNHKDKGASAATTTTTNNNNGRILWRRCNTICYVDTLLDRTI
jgi:hypothetical protein